MEILKIITKMLHKFKINFSLAKILIQILKHKINKATKMDKTIKVDIF
jgi:hypothetical protein